MLSAKFVNFLGFSIYEGFDLSVVLFDVACMRIELMLSVP